MESILNILYREVLWLLAWVAAIIFVLTVLRLLWVLTPLGLILFRAAHSGRKIETPGWRLIVATSVAGVRGAVIPAGMLTLPLTRGDGSPCPARGLVREVDLTEARFRAS